MRSYADLAFENRGLPMIKLGQEDRDKFIRDLIHKKLSLRQQAQPEHVIRADVGIKIFDMVDQGIQLQIPQSFLATTRQRYN